MSSIKVPNNKVELINLIFTQLEVTYHNQFHKAYPDKNSLNLAKQLWLSQLQKFDEKLEVICLEQSARTAQDAATALGCEVGAIVKSLLFKAGDRFILSLVAGDNRCSLNKLKKILNEKDVSMASPEDVKDNTGYTIGGVSPVGHLKKCDIYVDKSLERFSDIFGAAGHPNAVFKINYNDLLKMTKGHPKDIVE